MNTVRRIPTSYSILSLLAGTALVFAIGCGSSGESDASEVAAAMVGEENADADLPDLDANASADDGAPASDDADLPDSASDAGTDPDSDADAPTDTGVGTYGGSDLGGPCGDNTYFCKAPFTCSFTAGPALLGECVDQ